MKFQCTTTAIANSPSEAGAYYLLWYHRNVRFLPEKCPSFRGNSKQLNPVSRITGEDQITMPVTIDAA